MPIISAPLNFAPRKLARWPHFVPRGARMHFVLYSLRCTLQASLEITLVTTHAPVMHTLSNTINCILIHRAWHNILDTQHIDRTPIIIKNHINSPVTQQYIADEKEEFQKLTSWKILSDAGQPRIGQSVSGFSSSSGSNRRSNSNRYFQ